MPGYATTYYPGSPAASDAQFVTVGLSQDVPNIDFALALVPTSRIAGTTLNAAGEPFQGGIQMRTSRRSGSVVADSVGARTERDGTFEFPNVPSGEYVVHAFHGGELAWQFVGVNGADVTGLVMQTLPGSTIAGRFTFEGGAAPGGVPIELSPVPADPDVAPFAGNPARIEVKNDWTFTISGAAGPSRLQLTRAPG